MSSNQIVYGCLRPHFRNSASPSFIGARLIERAISEEWDSTEIANHSLMIDKIFEQLAKVGLKQRVSGITGEVANSMGWPYLVGEDAMVTGTVFQVVCAADKLGRGALEPEVTKSVEEQTKLASAWMDMPGASFLTSKFQATAGLLDQQQCFCSLKLGDTRSQSSGGSESLGLIVLLANPLDLGLTLSTEDWISKVGKFIGFKDVEIGDRAFDDKFLLKAKKPEQARKLFQSDAVSEAFRPFLSSGSEARDLVVNDIAVRCRFFNKAWNRGDQIPPDRAEEACQLLADLAKLAAQLSDQPFDS